MDEIQNIVDQICRLVHPEKIILFGSAARGESRDGSDIDLLIVVPEGTPKRPTAQFLYRELSNIRVPYDLLVATAGEMEKHKDNIGLIYKTIIEEGKVIYAA